MTQPPDSSPTAVERRRDAWTRYWSAGALHSCAGSFAGNYAGAIGEFWTRVFAALPAQAEVLDLCCGNAPLAKLLLESPAWRAEPGRVRLADLARLDPPWLRELDPGLRARVGLLAGVDVAALPVETASVDLCMSQFGVEYIGPAAISEARRVLRPGALLAAVLHHQNALPVRIARAELEHRAWLREHDPLARVQAMFEPMALSATPAGRETLRLDPGAQRVRMAFERALADVHARLADAAYPDVLHEFASAAAGLLRIAREHGAAAAFQACERWREDDQAAALRQQELVDCALDESALRTLVSMPGWKSPELRELRFDNGEIAGWALQLRRD